MVRSLSLIVGMSLWSYAGHAQTQSEMDKHQGTWAVVSFVREGHETPEEICKQIKRVVRGNHVVWKRNGKSFAGTTIEVDASKQPMTIDVIPDGGPSKGQ